MKPTTDGCQDNPCTEGTNCTDLTAAEEVSTADSTTAASVLEGQRKMATRVTVSIADVTFACWFSIVWCHYSFYCDILSWYYISD